MTCCCTPPPITLTQHHTSSSHIHKEIWSNSRSPLAERSRTADRVSPATRSHNLDNRVSCILVVATEVATNTIRLLSTNQVVISSLLRFELNQNSHHEEYKEVDGLDVPTSQVRPISIIAHYQGQKPDVLHSSQASTLNHIHHVLIHHPLNTTRR